MISFLSFFSNSSDFRVSIMPPTHGNPPPAPPFHPKPAPPIVSINTPQARVVALAVSQGAWGPLPGPTSVAPGPIDEDIVQVALSAGHVPSLGGAEGGGETAVAVQKGATSGGDRDGGGGGEMDGGGVGKVEEGGVLWLSLPFVAALLTGASPDARQQAAMTVNIAFKVTNLWVWGGCVKNHFTFTTPLFIGSLNSLDCISYHE